jgi:asparagine synthase (glutamine-hydrolysing)
MCGIAGIVSFGGEPVARADVAHMTDALAHRGPDGDGVWTDGHVGFGHRRLAIRDLSPAGAQPMIDGKARIERRFGSKPPTAGDAALSGNQNSR